MSQCTANCSSVEVKRYETFEQLVQSIFDEYLNQTKNTEAKYGPRILKQRVKAAAKKCGSIKNRNLEICRMCIKSCNHQWHLNMRKKELDEAAERLYKSQVWKNAPQTNPDISDFEQLFNAIVNEMKDTKYIGGQTTYDTALSVGQFFEQEIVPEKYVYMISDHVVTAFNALTENGFITKDAVEKDLSRPRGKVAKYLICETSSFSPLINLLFENSTPDVEITFDSMVIEDFLCILGASIKKKKQNT